MARIEPIPWDHVPEESRAMMEAGLATGMYTSTAQLQIIAYSTAALTAMHRQYESMFRRGVLEPRLVELLRLHGARMSGCEPCAASRKDPTVSEEDVACLLTPDTAQFNPRERAALLFFDRLATDHYSINDETFHELAEVFTTAEIVEMAFLCSSFLGGHRLMHTLDLLGSSEPVLRYEPGSVDRSTAVANRTA